MLDGHVPICLTRMFNSYVWYPQFEVISRPVFKLRLLLWPLLRDVEIGKEDEGGVARDEDEDMPDAVHVGEVDGEPRVAEHAVDDPAEHGEEAHGHAAEAESVHAGALNSAKR